MITARRALLQKLRTLWPALADNDIVPGYTHFLFTGDSIVANNERIAISVPLHAGFKGLLPPLLLEVLAGSTSPAVEIEADGRGVARVTLGASVTCLPMQPLEHYRFEMPTARPQHRVTASFLHGIEHCLLSVSSYAIVADQLGVTLDQRKDELGLYATNRSTIGCTRLSPSPVALAPRPMRSRRYLDESRAELERMRKQRPKIRRRVILSTAFCDQMLALAKTAKVLRLEIFDDFALFAADDAVLFGKLIGLSNTPLDFVYVVGLHLPKNFDALAIPISKELRAVLKRAAHLTAIIGSETKTKIIVKRGMATVAAQSERGQLSERLALPKHPDAECNVNARLLVEGLRTGLDRVLFTERCAILARGEHYFLVAAFDD